ncbi:Very-short-patch-repair endonuclease [Halobacillus dabanensis]|uniref:Very-short-patch-repair endonuclease n=2 Tax=Halobacillus dabanensis TaxID=240302 RepID=A0A1I3SR85_HALDA|nr:Very-short-patch-repair endonuclease [Halobacillus dabanensis]
MNLTMFIEYAAFMSLMVLAILLTLRVKDKNEDTTLSESEVFSSTLVRKLYEGFLSHGLQPTLQYRCDQYTIDVAFPELKIAVEAVEHDFLISSDVWEREWEKESYLKNHGWTVMRFSGARIDEDLSRIVEKVSREMTSKSNSS